MNTSTFNVDLLKTQLRTAPLSSIASVIKADWGTVSPYARPYLKALFTLGNMSDMYGLDDGKTIVLYFLSNAAGWRGEVARVVKAELKRRCGV